MKDNIEKKDHRFHLVLFDLGGTLIHFNGDVEEVNAASELRMLSALQNAELRLDLPRFLVDFRKRVRSYHMLRDSEFVEYTTRRVLGDLLEEYQHPCVPDKTLDYVLSEMYAVSQEHWVLEEDALSTLDTLKAEGYRLGLISNASDEQDVRTLLERNRLASCFEHVLISAVVGYRKPHPQMLRLALEAFNIPPEKAVMVGDTLGADILGANYLKIASIWITRRAIMPTGEDADRIQPSATITTLAELPNLLACWPG